MTMVYCQTCGEDVHITADCVTNREHAIVGGPAPEPDPGRRASSDESVE